MNYPDELKDIVDHWYADNMFLDLKDIYLIAQQSYKLGLEKGWQYQQDNDRMQNEETE